MLNEAEQIAVWFMLSPTDRVTMSLDELSQRFLLPTTCALIDRAGGFLLTAVAANPPTPFAGLVQMSEPVTEQFDRVCIRLTEYYNLLVDMRVFSADTMAPARPKQLQFFF